MSCEHHLSARFFLKIAFVVSRAINCEIQTFITQQSVFIFFFVFDFIDLLASCTIRQSLLPKDFIRINWQKWDNSWIETLQNHIIDWILSLFDLTEIDTPHCFFGSSLVQYAPHIFDL